MNPRINTWLNYDPSDVAHFEHNSGKSSTVPDQTYSLRQILENHTIRAQVPVLHSAYTGDIETPDLDRMDLVERDEFLQETKRNNQDAEATLKERKRILAENRKKKAEQEASPTQPVPTPPSGGEPIKS